MSFHTLQATRLLVRHVVTEDEGKNEVNKITGKRDKIRDHITKGVVAPLFILPSSYQNIVTLLQNLGLHEKLSASERNAQLAEKRHKAEIEVIIYNSIILCRY